MFSQGYPFFLKLKNLSFHKIFPQLDKNFTDTARGVGDISGDKLAEFIENYCGVENRFFETPERTLFSFEKSRLENIFLEILPHIFSLRQYLLPE